MSSSQLAYGMGKLLASLTPRGYYFKHTNDKYAQLAYAHYSDPNFEYPGSIIFGQQQDGVKIFNSQSVPYKVWDEAYKQATEASGIKHHCVLNVERTISTCLGRDIDVVYVRAYADDSGYPAYYYGYKEI